MGAPDKPYEMHTSLQRRSCGAVRFLNRCCGWRWEDGDAEDAWAVRGHPAGKRGAFTLARLLEHGRCGVSLRGLGGDRAGEVRLDRWLRNPRVSPAEMVATARAHLRSRVSARHVLVIQDTTGLRDDGDRCGLYLHPSIALDAGHGALLGLLDAEFLVHDGLRKLHHNQRRLTDKESRRWIDATCQAADLLEAGAAGVTMIADREADIYDAFAYRPPGVDLLVRAHHDRRLIDGRSLYECYADLPDLGLQVITVPAAPGRKARTARMAVRAGSVEIKRPKRSRVELTADLPPSISLRLVEAREIDPPAGDAGLHWRLLTTHAVDSLADANWIIGLYRQRWVIEQVFRVMKTDGFDIEAVGLADDAPLKNLACATLIAAIQVQQMLHDRDGTAERPMADLIDPADQPLVEAIGHSLEGRTQRQKNPAQPASLAFLTWVCARLGGWTGYYGKPGPIVLIRGFVRLQTMIEGIKRCQLV